MTRRLPRRLHGWIMCVLFGSALPATAGDVTGFVKFPGETPPPHMIANAVDAACPRGIGQNHLIVRQENRGIKNALVVLEVDEESPTSMIKTVGLKSQGCTFVPRVQWTTMPSTLNITNEDNTDQDVDALIDDVRVFAVRIDGKGTTVKRPLARQKLYKITSHDHPWMQAWVYVSAHPYVALTDTYGHFVIHNAPAGKTMLRAWHEGWTVKGNDRAGRPQFQPMEETKTVAVPREGSIEVFFENLLPTF